ncbi:hypothetical protein [Limnohabitans lacus]|uniref:Uncharacterized protein n=1 Tax=Limnohabitans lacus TaxID=3045173 RepID=A0ABT6X906_9BURK|nr:hypothetical protein [Limnohabitans sp. HM2-2]MDI9234599.1 hypothetical protein [Limnohabitans sp. HM2-2]
MSDMTVSDIMSDGNFRITTRTPFKLKRRPGIKTVVISPETTEGYLDGECIDKSSQIALFQGLARAHYWQRLLDEGKVRSGSEIAKLEELDPSTVNELLRLKALKKIRHYVESHDKAIRKKAEIMVDHFVAQVAGKQKIGGKARAMIVCNGIARAIDYYREVSDYLASIKSPFKAIVAYSGDFEISGVRKTEADLNDFPSKDIPSRLKQDPYLARAPDGDIVEVKHAHLPLEMHLGA